VGAYVLGSSRGAAGPAIAAAATSPDPWSVYAPPGRLAPPHFSDQVGYRVR
jgi:hypothetical protein